MRQNKKWLLFIELNVYMLSNNSKQLLNARCGDFNFVTDWRSDWCWWLPLFIMGKVEVPIVLSFSFIFVLFQLFFLSFFSCVVFCFPISTFCLILLFYCCCFFVTIDRYSRRQLQFHSCATIFSVQQECACAIVELLSYNMFESTTNDKQNIKLSTHNSLEHGIRSTRNASRL